MYSLYGGKFTRAQIVQMLMAEAGIDYELVEIDIIKQQHRSPEYLAINPAGYVPALRLDNGEVMHETHAINLYLIDQHRLEHLGPLPGDPQRGAFLSGLFFMADDLEPILKCLFYPQRYVLDEAEVRLHVPVQTNADIKFWLNDKLIPLQAGDLVSERQSAAPWCQSMIGCGC